jgi:hypothetical protein
MPLPLYLEIIVTVARIAYGSEGARITAAAMIAAVALIALGFAGAHWFEEHSGSPDDCAARLIAAKLSLIDTQEDLWELEEQRLEIPPGGLQCPCSPELGEDD